jgi:uncharacterized protein YndB with AHSA1/START domain
MPWKSISPRRIDMHTDSRHRAAGGTLEVRDDDTYVLRFERRLAHPPEKVWRALTEPEQLRKWFPTDIEGERRLGAKLRFVFREDAPTAAELPELLEHDPVDLDGEFTEFDPPLLLAYTWGEESLRWELDPTEEGCRLVFTHTFDERSGIPHPGGPRKKAARTASGWEICLAGLAAILDDASTGGDGAEPDWQELYKAYVGRFA